MTALSGGFVNYYLVQVLHPQRVEQPPYQAECEDIIRALNMTFDEGCEFKAIWRTAAARLGNGKPGQKELYDAEKRVHYATASLRAYQRLSTEPKPVAEVAQEPLEMEGIGREYDTWYAYNADIGTMPEGLHFKSIVTMRRVNGDTMGPQNADMVDWGLYRKRASEPRAWAGVLVHSIPPTDEQGWMDNTGERPAWLPRGAMVEAMLESGDIYPAKQIDDWSWKKDDTSSAIRKYRPVA